MQILPLLPDGTMQEGRESNPIPICLSHLLLLSAQAGGGRNPIFPLSVTSPLAIHPSGWVGNHQEKPHNPIYLPSSCSLLYFPFELCFSDFSWGAWFFSFLERGGWGRKGESGVDGEVAAGDDLAVFLQTNNSLSSFISSKV